MMGVSLLVRKVALLKYSINLSVVLIFIFIVTATANAAAPNLIWSTTNYAAYDQIGVAMQRTSDGGYVVAGYTSGPDGSSAPHYFDLLKADASGHVLWNKTYGNDGDEYGSYAYGMAVAQASDGGYAIVGTRYPNDSTGYDVYLVKTDANGIELWNKTYGGGNEEDGSSIARTSDGGYIISGLTFSYGNGSDDVYLVKVDAAGNEQWEKTFGGSQSDEGLDARQTADGGYIVAGYTNSSGSGGSDVYLVKTDASGNEQWNKTFGGAAEDLALSVLQTADGGYVAAGMTYSYGNGSDDFYLVKTNATGNKQWEKTYGGSNYEKASSVLQTADGGYILTGGNYSSLTNTRSVYLVKTAANGNEEWETNWGAAGDDKGSMVVQDPDGSYVVGGFVSADGTTYPHGLLLLKYAIGASDTIPGTMVAGNTYNASVTFVNQGSTTWTSGAGDKLVFWGQRYAFNLNNDTLVNGYPAFSLPAGVSVLPGQSYSWNLSLTPVWSGTYGLGFQMTETGSNTWLGSANSKTMTVAAAAPNSSLAGTSIPATMVESNAYGVSITYTNTGNSAWTGSKGDKLVMWGQLWAYTINNDTSVNGYPAFSMPSNVTVQPGQSYAWNLSLTPIWSGTYGLGFQVVQTSTNTWMGSYSNKAMLVYAGAPNSSYVNNSIPNNMANGTTYNIKVNFTNTGNTTWTQAKGDKLVMWGQTGQLGLNNDTVAYGYPAFSIPAGVTVHPGQTYSWNVTMRPTTAGNYSIGFQAVQTSTGTWMGNTGGKTIAVS
jgi:hypothetical protein